MTLYCKPGQEPRVEFKFKNKGLKNFTAKESPIDVSVVQLPITETRNGILYAWNFSTNLNPRVTLEDMPFRSGGALTDYKVGIVSDRRIENGREIARYFASFRDGNGTLINGSAVGYFPNDAPIFVFLPLLEPDPPIERDCKITIKNLAGKLLYQEVGKCPVRFKIACEGCPPDYIKCHSDAYPGYCCIPCDEMSSGIKQLTSKVRNING